MGRCRLFSGRGLALQVFTTAIGAGNDLDRRGRFDLDALQVEFAPAIPAHVGMRRCTAPVMADDIGVTRL